MDHKGIAYAIRTGIERDTWVVAVDLPDGQMVEKRVYGHRRMAEVAAISIIDRWLEKNRREAR